jgi:hypothetical protein
MARFLNLRLAAIKPLPRICSPEPEFQKSMTGRPKRSLER